MLQDPTDLITEYESEPNGSKSKGLTYPKSIFVSVLQYNAAAAGGAANIEAKLLYSILQ